MENYVDSNRALWNEMTPLHERSGFYDVAGFKAGRCTLKKLELEEVDDVSGKSLLHLQCHFGLDTLSWARKGAAATGMDFSEQAIDLARRLSRETGIGADFICANVFDLPDVLPGQFDIVFTSYGVLTWMPDLTKWAQVAAHFVKPGGFFYITEFHPITLVFNDNPESTKPEVILPYFQGKEALEFGPSPDYASGNVLKHHSYEWQYPVGDVITALAGAGLHIDFLHEFPFTCYKALPYLKQGEDGLWRLPGDPLPLSFSIKATRPYA